MIFYIYAACAFVMLPLVENADTYNFYEDAGYELSLTHPDNIVEVCRVSYYTDVVYQYTAENEAAETGLSPTLTVQWVPDFDRDDDGVVGFADFGQFAAVFGSDHPDDLWADADEDGVVGFADFGAFVARFGRCNNDTFEVVCAR